MSKQKEWLLHSKKVKIKKKHRIRFKISTENASCPKGTGIFVREELECPSPVYSRWFQISKGTRRMLQFTGRSAHDLPLSVSPLISVLLPLFYFSNHERYAIKTSIKENPSTPYHVTSWHYLSTYQVLSYGRHVYYTFNPLNKPCCGWGNSLSLSLI